MPSGYEPMPMQANTLVEDVSREPSSRDADEATKQLLQDHLSVRQTRVVTGFVFTLPSTFSGCMRMLFTCDDDASDEEDADYNGEKENKKAELHHKTIELEEELRVSNMRRDRIQNKYNELLEGVNEEIKALEHQIENTQHLIQELEVHHEHHQPEEPLPGPQSLKWVEGTAASTISNVVIVLNIVVLFSEIGNKENTEKYKYLDHGFMIFYCVELALKWALWRHMFLIGKISVVWWHWLDLSIVVSGVLEMWIYPACVATGVIQNHGNVTWLRMLRLGRLARIVKIISAILRQNLDWVEGPKFQVFIQGVIMVNSLVIAFECDIPEFPGWVVVEQVMLAIFSFEVAARLKHWGFCLFFIKNVDDLVWNWLDFIIVFGGIVDQWMMPGIQMVQIMLSMEPMQPSKLGNVMMLLRMARLLRILRLVRLIHSIPPLYQLIISIALALKGMLWVLVLSFIILYIFALLAVRLISHGLVFGGEAPEDVAAIFPTVPQSIFVLFQVMNGDTDMLEPLFLALPAAQFFFMVFTVLSSWAILSILTAVISEKMMKAALDYETEEAEKDSEIQEAHTQAEMEKFFDMFDKDHDGKLTLEEWKEMMQEKDKVNQLTDATGLTESDIKDLFSFLSRADNVDRNGNPVIKVDRQAFIRGCKTLKENVTEASIMRLEKQLWEVRKSIRDKIDKNSQNVLSKKSFDIHFNDKWQTSMREGLENMKIRFDHTNLPVLDEDENVFLEEAHDSHGKCVYRRNNAGHEKNSLFQGGYSVENSYEDNHVCNGFYHEDGTYNSKPRYKNVSGAIILYEPKGGRPGWRIVRDSFTDPAFVLDSHAETPPPGHWRKFTEGDNEAKNFCRVYEAGRDEALPEVKDFPLTFTVVSKRGLDEKNDDVRDTSRIKSSMSSWFWTYDR